MTKVEIIEETVKFYSADTKLRSIADNSCVYNSGDGRHCAVGRCFLPRQKERGVSFDGNFDGVDCLHDKYNGLDKLLEEKYCGHNISFWSDLQLLHDKEEYWDNNGLTTSGQIHVANLTEKYGREDINKIKELAERFGVFESQITLTKDN